MVENVGGSGAINPKDKVLYEQEYKHGADLFQRALEQHAKADNIYKKEEFKEVMDKALMVLNETARELKKKDLDSQNEIITKDYNAYKSTPSPDHMTKLSQDLEKAKGDFHMKGEK